MAIKDIMGLFRLYSVFPFLPENLALGAIVGSLLCEFWLLPKLFHLGFLFHVGMLDCCQLHAGSGCLFTTHAQWKVIA